MSLSALPLARLRLLKDHPSGTVSLSALPLARLRSTGLGSTSRRGEWNSPRAPHPGTSRRYGSRSALWAPLDGIGALLALLSSLGGARPLALPRLGRTARASVLAFPSGRAARASVLAFPSGRAARASVLAFPSGRAARASVLAFPSGRAAGLSVFWDSPLARIVLRPAYLAIPMPCASGGRDRALGGLRSLTLRLCGTRRQVAAARQERLRRLVFVLATIVETRDANVVCDACHILIATARLDRRYTRAVRGRRGAAHRGPGAASARRTPS